MSRIGSVLSWLTFALGLAGLLILLQGQSDDPAILGRYSPRYAVVMLVYTLSMVSASVIFSLPFPQLKPLVWFGIGVIGLAIAAWLPLLSHTWALNATLRLSALWLVLAVLWKSQADLPNWRIWALLMLIVVLIVSGLSLIDYPFVQMIDEGWNANLAVTFVHEGVFYTRINQGVFGIPELFVPVANVLPGYWFIVAGTGLLQARWISFAGGALLLALTYVSALRLYRNQQVALLAVLLLAGSTTFLQMSHLFRLDIYVAVAAMAALYLFLRAERQSALAFVAGIILSTAFEIHQNAALLATASGIYLIGMVLLRILRTQRPVITRREIAFMLGGMLGSLVFVIFHVLPNPSEFLIQFTRSMNLRGAERLPDWTDQFGWFGFLVRGVRMYLPLSAAETALVIVGFFVAGAVKQVRGLLALSLIILIVYGVAAPYLTPGYLINFWPVIALMGARTLWACFHNRRVLLLATCTAVALPGLFGIAAQMATRTNAHIIELAAEINATLEPNDRVVALHSFFLLMPHPPELIAPFMHDYAEQVDAPLQGLDLWRSLSPTVFIVAPALSEPLDTIAARYRAQAGFVETARYDQVGCCIYVYRQVAASP